MSGVRQLTVGAEEADQRLDRWLRRLHPQVNQAPHRAHVPQGRNPRRRRPGQARRPGSRPARSCGCRRSPSEGAAARAPPPPAISDADAAMIRAAVLYRDDDVIALDKPPGLAVQGGSGQQRHVDGLAEALRFGRADKPRLVHRLDRDTSGVLLLGAQRPRRGRARPRLPGARDAQGLLGRGRRRAEPAGRHDPHRPRQGAGPRRRPARARRCWSSPSDRGRGDRGRQARDHRLRGDRRRRDPRRLGRARAGHRPHPPAPRPHGGDRPPDRRRRQVRRQRPGEPRRRLGRPTRRRGQPQAAPARPLDRARPSDDRQAAAVTAPLPEHMARTWDALRLAPRGRAGRPVRGRA